MNGWDFTCVYAISCVWSHVTPIEALKLCLKPSVCPTWEPELSNSKSEAKEAKEEALKGAPSVLHQFQFSYLVRHRPLESLADNIVKEILFL